MEASTGSIFCEVVDDILMRWRPTTDNTAAGAEAVREKRVAAPVPALVATKCDECEAKDREGVKAAVPSDEKGEDVKASKDAANRELSNALL
jgi:hypothetical protein